MDEGHRTSSFTKTSRRHDSNSCPESSSQTLSTGTISSSSYPFPGSLNLDTVGISNSSSQQILYGGLSLYNDESEDRDDDPTTNPCEQPSKLRSAKRRSTMNDAIESKSSRKRGRPRMLTKDETATERRRTQIRLAQRAYRLRKEATISSLNERVAELEAAIEEMSKSFLSFNDEIMDSGLLPLQPDLVHSLRNITENFLSLTRSTKTDNDPDTEISKILEPKEGVPLSGKDHDYDFLEGADDVTFQPSLNSTWRRVDSSNTLRNSMPLVGDILSQQNPTIDDAQDVHTITLFNNQSTSISLSGISDGQLSHLSPIDNSLLPAMPYTYSFGESTFARRLHRCCLERGYRLLTDPTANPEELLRAFRFTFGISNKKRIISRFQKILKRGVDEALEAWNLPFFYLGGAGTHYPRKDTHGNPVYPPNMHPVTEVLGPQPFHLAETPHENENLESLLAAIGFDGEWFDSHDVESYLREKGIFLNGYTSFVELPQARLLQRPLEDEQSNSYNALNCAPGISEKNGFLSPDEGCKTIDPQVDSLSNFTKTDSIQSSMQLLNGVSSADIETMEILSASSSSSRASLSHEAPISRDFPATFDAGQFVDRLVGRAVCLGRAPGFRRRDVEDSLQFATRPVF